MEALGDDVHSIENIHVHLHARMLPPSAHVDLGEIPPFPQRFPQMDNTWPLRVLRGALLDGLPAV